FTAGDLTGGGGNPPYQTIDLETPLAPLIGDIDVLKVSHHGSHTSSNEFFLDTLQPEMAIISVGANNDFGHPHRTVLERLEERQIEIWKTTDGSVCILSNGKEIQIKSYAVDNCATPP
ncbi:MAG: hypothetical protein Q7S68_03435, partial [Deltaproteobacteria bacterium]|nr:hypothetical protein [Deltaproteobacteria bacterium]